ncbi:MAG: TonB-dependent receptor plug domain-containing protein, partial [Burkholderiales bacterium]
MTREQKLYSHTQFLASLVAVVAMALPQTALAQEAPATTELETIEVTGSRIKRVDLEGPLPVTVITRDQLDAAGDLTVSDFLRTLPFNSFGSFQPISISGGGGGTQASLSLRGVGAARTLVLVDGRRLPASPAFSGAAQNLNTIPLAVVDRIEVLREGASAVYGSDAIGGVINVITKKDFQGGVAFGQLDRPSEEGGDSANANVVTGLAASQGNFYVAIDHAQRDIVFTRDRSYLIDTTKNPPSPTGFPGSFRRRNMNFGAVGVGSTTSGVTDTTQGFFADPSCPAAFDTDPLAPNSRVQVFGGTLGERCAFRFASTAGEQPEQDRDTLLASGNLKLTDDLSFFSRMSFTRLSSFNNLAPSPAPTANRVLNGDNPLNPTFNEIRDDDNDGFADAPAPDANGDGRPDNAGYTIDYAFRFVPLGTRNVDVRDDVQQLVFGLNGDLALLDGSTWEAAYVDNRYKQDVAQANLFLFSEFLAAVADGSLNPFDLATFTTTAARVRHTGLVSQETTSRGVDGHINLGTLPLPIRVSTVVGAEYREDAYFTVPDGQSQFGNVVGSSGGNAAGGDRDYNALYAEAGAMFFDNILEVSLAVRRDDYSDFGSNISPKLSLAVRPIEQLLVRASIGEGFRAPDLETLFSTAIQSFEFINDTLECNQTMSGCGVAGLFQQETNFTSNPALDAET